MNAPFARGFAHLHVRSGFSYGYGVATPEELVGGAAEMGMGAMALTDRDGLYGIPRFLEAAGRVGVSP
ncbi:MAG: PHP domain-containing protein, partial [Rubrobacter sp.]|nr:PHP domain-containing protein [Rubrobacter sp.]